MRSAQLLRLAEEEERARRSAAEESAALKRLDDERRSAAVDLEEAAVAAVKAREAQEELERRLEAIASTRTESRRTHTGKLSVEWSR